jgi:hypothetical protein
MSNMLILKPLTATVADFNGNLSGVANVLTFDPKEAMIHPANVGAAVLDFDLGSPQLIDCFYIGYHGYNGQSLTITGGAAAYNTTTHLVDTPNWPAPSPVQFPLRRHAFIRLAAPVINRFVRLQFSGAAVRSHIGVVAIGLAFRPFYNREWGSGRQPIDTGSRETLRGGGFGIGEGARKAAFRWTFGDLDTAEVDALYNLSLEVGETRPIIVAEDPDFTVGLNERLHYGLFDRFEEYSRQDTTKTRWSMGITQWV